MGKNSQFKVSEIVFYFHLKEDGAISRGFFTLLEQSINEAVEYLHYLFFDCCFFSPGTIRCVFSLAHV